MNRKIRQQHILSILAEGPRKSFELRCLAGNISRVQLARLLSDLGDQILSFGASRATRYARPRDIKGIGNAFEVFKVDATGDAQRLGVIQTLQGGYYRWESEDGDEDLSTHLPWFIQDLAPEGFLGRALVRRLRDDFSFPVRLHDWNDDHVLAALAFKGENLPGDLVVGATSLQKFFSATRRDTVISKPSEYPRLAEEALNGHLPANGLIGGQQPKFVTITEREGMPMHVVVKFSPLVTAPAGVRWSDLLVCEHIALSVVKEAGIQAAESKLIVTEDRAFLEIERFDRVGRHGRMGMYSIGTIDDEFFGCRDTWTDMAERMGRAGMLTEEDCEKLRWLDLFGALIANSDRHFGNVSVQPISPGRNKFRLAPVYDMLPMHYAPIAGAALGSGPMPLPKQLSGKKAAASALEAAEEFWGRAATDDRITASFQEVCTHNKERISRERRCVGNP